jgi:hypothetical protein
MAGQWEPDESRGSRPVLRGAGAEMPRSTHAVLHCVSEAQAKQVLSEIVKRLAAFKLEVHPEKTKIVYCKTANRTGQSKNLSFDFLGYTFRPRSCINSSGKIFLGYGPGISNKAGKRIREEIKSWKLHLRSSASLQEIAKSVNAQAQGWINYYGRFNKRALQSTLAVFNKDLIKWGIRKYKRCVTSRLLPARTIVADQYTIPLTSGYRYSALLTQPFGTALTDPQMAESGAHEIGHAVDYLKGWSTNSGSANFNVAIQWDFLDLDYNNRDQTDPKKPCGGTDKKGNPYSGPLVNVVDPTTAKQFCNGQTLESKWGTQNATTILRTSSVGSDYWNYLAAGKVGQENYPGGWSEWYAQAFAIQVNQKTNGGGIAIVQDQVVANTFFQCTAGTGSSGTIHGFLWYIYNSTALGLPTTCTSKLPTWWTPLQ